MSAISRLFAPRTAPDVGSRCTMQCNISRTPQRARNIRTERVASPQDEAGGEGRINTCLSSAMLRVACCLAHAAYISTRRRGKLDMFLENDIDSLLRGLHCDARSKRCCPRRLVCRTRPSMRPCRMRRKRNATPSWRRCNRSRCKPKPLQTEAVANRAQPLQASRLWRRVRASPHRQVRAAPGDRFAARRLLARVVRAARHLNGAQMPTPMAITAIARSLASGRPFCGRWESVAQ